MEQFKQYNRSESCDWLQHVMLTGPKFHIIIAILTFWHTLQNGIAQRFGLPSILAMAQ
jgi:hypothetical protein